MILFLGSGAGVLAASTAATAAVWLLATPWRRQIARTEVTEICNISASEISSRKKLDTDPTIANKLAQTVLLFNIIISLSACALKNPSTLGLKPLHPILSLTGTTSSEAHALFHHKALLCSASAPFVVKLAAYAFFGPTGSTSCRPWFLRLPYQSFFGL